MPIYSVRYIGHDVDTSSISQTYQYTPNKKGEIGAKGELFSLMTIEGSNDIDCDRIGKFVWDAIVDNYYFSPFNSVIDNLKESVAIGARKASDLIRNELDLEGKGVNLSFSLVVFKGMSVYITVFGESQVYLYKNNGIVKVSDIVIQNKGVVASLAWSQNDLLLLASPNMLDKYTEVLSRKDGVQDIIKGIGVMSSNLKGSESVFLLAGKQYSAPTPKVVAIPAEKKEDVNKEVKVEKELDIEKVKKEILDSENKIEDIKEDTKNTIEVKKIKPNIKTKFDISVYINRLKEIKLLEKVKPVLKKIIEGIKPFLQRLKSLWNRLVDFIFKVWSKITGKLNSLVQNKYGRTHWYKSMMSKLTSLTFGKRKSSGVGIKIDGYKEKDTRKKRFTTLFLIIIGIASIFILINLGKKASEDRKIRKEASQLMIVLTEKLQILQNQDKYDQDTVDFTENEILTELIPKLDGMKLPEGVFVDYDKLKKKYQEYDDKKYKRFFLTDNTEEFSLFFDGRAELGGSVALGDISPYKDDFQNEFILVTDSGNSKVYKISMSDKSYVPISDTKGVVKDPKYIDYGTKGVYVFDEQAGMLRASFNKQGAIGNFSQIAGLDRDVIGRVEVNDIAIIGENDNIYFLSKSEKAVLKSSGYSSGYSLPFPHIESKNFTNANNLANDISIYVMTTGDKGIERYSYNYVSQTFEINRVTTIDFDGELGNLKAGFTSFLETSKMFVFDEGIKRLLVLEKPNERAGELKHPKQLWMEKQFLYKGERTDVFSNVLDLASDYFDKYLYVLDGNKIWRVKIN